MTGGTIRKEHQGPLALLVALLEIVIVGLFVSTFVAEPARVPSASMSPGLLVGDLVLLDRQSYAPSGWMDRALLPPARVRRGDVAVFLLAEGRLGGAPQGHTLLVKRVIGLPGDRLQMHAGSVVVNGVPLAEPYAVFASGPADAFRDEFPSLGQADPAVAPEWWAFLRQQVAAGKGVIVPPEVYFVLGDNRNQSEDSRYWGFVPAEGLLGRPVGVYWRARR